MNGFITKNTLKLNPEYFKNRKIQVSVNHYFQLEKAINITSQEETVLYISNL